MFLSRIKLNILGDPNMPRYGRDLLKNAYHLHQRLSRAFGAMEKRGPMRAPRSEETMNFLYRVDAPRILVLSTQKPNWEKAFEGAGYLLADSRELPESNPFDPPLEKGQRLQFMLRANPTRKACVSRSDGGQIKSKTGNSKRTVLITLEDRLAWLRRKGEAGGFLLVESGLQVIDEGWVHAWKTYREDKEKDEVRIEPKENPHDADRHKGLSFRSVRYFGELMVTDPIVIRKTLATGIGSGKAFGFGLLSIARI